MSDVSHLVDEHCRIMEGLVDKYTVDVMKLFEKYKDDTFQLFKLALAAHTEQTEKKLSEMRATIWRLERR